MRNPWKVLETKVIEPVMSKYPLEAIFGLGSVGLYPAFVISYIDPSLEPSHPAWLAAMPIAYVIGKIALRKYKPANTNVS